jgi:transposase
MCGLTQARYWDFDKTHLQNIACATATNLLRIINWLNQVPFAETRTSRFAALAA